MLLKGEGRDHHDHVVPGGNTGNGAVEWEVYGVAVLAVVVAAALAYAVALWASRQRSPWPKRRTAAWYLGVLCMTAGTAGPIAEAAHESFTAHMAGHVLLGMMTPLFMVRAAPVTLLLRSVPVIQARSLSRFLRSFVPRLLTHPLIAAALNGGGLWLLYTGGVFEMMHTSALVHGVVHLHVFVAGYLFTASMVGTDPDPHRASLPIRSVVLISFIASHSILAKWLYAHPPAGVPASDAQRGAQLMYYGGDVVDVMIIVLLFAGWYRATAPRPGSGQENPVEVLRRRSQPGA